LNASRLKLTEIFRSLQGEADSVGIPTIFVRLTGCPLRCKYCDTAYAFHGGQWWALADILARVKELEATHVCVTGGEPLAQPAVLELMTSLCDAGYRVSLETSGAMPLERVDPRVVKVVDVKTPASGEESRNRYDELVRLQSKDLIKFAERCTVLFSPSHAELPARDLADWILEDRLPVRFQVQLHKYLWGDVPGR
jgi:7-carboxy-7-deazaguanine synthase